MRAVLTGVGGYLPKKILTNKDLEKILDTTDEWIQTRSGITKRHIAAEDEKTSDLATCAATRAMEDAGVEAKDIDLIILATTSPDLTFPATAAIIQEKLNIPPCPAFDIQAVCSGFLYALNMATTMLQAKQATRALVIGAEIMSRIVDWNDRSTAVLFGDGAGAFVLTAMEETEAAGRGVLGVKLYTDGRYANALCTKGKIRGEETSQNEGITMDGRTVFKHAVDKMAVASLEICALHNLEVTNMDLVIPHQANQRILDALAERLSIPSSKVISTIALHANTSAATIPLAFDVAKKEGRLNLKKDIQGGQRTRILVPAMGAGFTWGAGIIVV